MDTYTIETPVTKTKIEIRSWITGQAREDINRKLFRGMSVKTNGIGMNEAQMNDSFGESFIASEHAEIEAFVVSVNGEQEGVLQAILNLPEVDTAFVKEEIKKNSKATA